MHVTFLCVCVHFMYLLWWSVQFFADRSANELNSVAKKKKTTTTTGENMNLLFDDDKNDDVVNWQLTTTEQKKNRKEQQNNNRNKKPSALVVQLTFIFFEWKLSKSAACDAHNDVLSPSSSSFSPGFYALFVVACISCAPIISNKNPSIIQHTTQGNTHTDPEEIWFHNRHIRWYQKIIIIILCFVDGIWTMEMFSCFAFTHWSHFFWEIEWIDPIWLVLCAFIFVRNNNNGK